MWRAGSRARERSEGGAVALLVAVSLTLLLVAAAMVLDFGLIRFDKQINKAAADSAATAGGAALNQGDGVIRPWRGVCTAIAYLKANSTEMATMTGSYKSGAGAVVSGDPCLSGSALQNQQCLPSQPSSWAWFSGSVDDGRLGVEVKSGYVLPDPAFADDTVLSTDKGDNGAGGCDQLAVVVTERQKPGFGSLATSSDLVTRIRSVARTGSESVSEAPVALLLLERTSCQALAVNSTNTRIDILGVGTSPGVIHADSLGSGTCGNSESVLFGKFPQGIVARKAPTGGAPGMITTTALSGLPGAVPAKATDGAANVCAESGTACTAATGRGVVGRAPVDRRYLAGVRSAMGLASTEYARTTASATSAGYRVISGGCGNFSPSAAEAAAAKVFVNCPGGITLNNSTFANATDVVFNGSVTIKSNQTLSLPSAVRVYVKGAAGGTGVSASGSLSINQSSASTCATRTTAPRARLVIGNGSFTGGAQANFQMCHTSVLMAEGFTSACPLPTSTTSPGTAPYTNSCRGFIDVGGGGAMDWTAPNLVTAKATQTDWDQLEDLALWTETSTGSRIGGGGILLVSGVYFLPNAQPFTLSGQGTQSNGANAQFVARRLEASGQGTLIMKPNPNDVVTIPGLPTSGLVR